VIPTEIPDLPFNPADIKSIVGGGGHTLLLLRNGQVFGAGWNNSKQLGIDPTDKILSFSVIQNLQKYQICHLACSWDSSLAIASDGSLLVWGSNSFSQLGMPRNTVSDKFICLDTIN